MKFSLPLAAVWCVAWGVWSASAQSISISPVAVVLENGQRISGRLQPGETLAVSVTALGPTFTGTRIKTLQFADSEFQPPWHWPVQRVRLWGRQSLPAEVVKLETQQLSCHFLGGKLQQLPARYVASWEEEWPAALLCYESFSGEKLQLQTVAGQPTLANVPASAPNSANQAAAFQNQTFTLEYSFAERLTSGQVAFRLFISEPLEAGGTLFFHTAWGDQAAEVLLPHQADHFTVVATDQSANSPQPPLSFTVQPLARRAGWHNLLLSLEKDRVQWTLDGALLAHGKPPASGLTKIQFGLRNPLPAQKPITPWAYVDDLKIYRQLSQPPAPRTEWRQDCVNLVTGDQVFGKLTRWSPTELALHGPYGELTLPRHSVPQVQLTPEAHSLPALSGLWISAQFRSTSQSVKEDYRVEGVFHSVSSQHLQLQHPALGQLAIPLNLLRTIEVQNKAWRFTVDPVTYHLGSQIRPDFLKPMPDGPMWERTFDLELPKNQAGAAHLLLDVEHMEGNEISAPIMAGQLKTSVLFNDQLIEPSLNQHVQHARQRVRLPIPGGLLKQGRNKIRLALQPAAARPQDVGNFLLHGVALERELPEE